MREIITASQFPRRYFPVSWAIAFPARKEIVRGNGRKMWVVILRKLTNYFDYEVQQFVIRHKQNHRIQKYLQKKKTEIDDYSRKF